MPRGNPKKLIALRLDPALLEELRSRATNLTLAVEDGIRLWLAREKRKAAKADPLARHLAQPGRTLDELLTEGRDDAA
jgi:hypothetical protein